MDFDGIEVKPSASSNKVRRKRNAAKQFTCKSRFQQAQVSFCRRQKIKINNGFLVQIPLKQWFQVKILAQFQVNNDRTGERHYLGGFNRDVYMDVTDLSVKSVKSLDDSVALIRRKDKKIFVAGVASGETRIVLRSHFAGAAAALHYGSALLSVNSLQFSVKDKSIM